MTKHRQLIHRIIQEADDHLTADQIYFLAKQEMPSIAIGTVYRNLNLMVKDEEIRRVQLAGEPDRFDRALLPLSLIHIFGLVLEFQFPLFFPVDVLQVGQGLDVS